MLYRVKEVMRRCYAAILVMAVVAGILVSGAGAAQAYTGKGTNDPLMPTTWKQGAPMWMKIPLGKATRETLATAGCTTFGNTIMFRKAGIRNEKYTPDAFREESMTMNSAGKLGAIQNDGMMNWGGVEAQSGGKLINYKRVDYPTYAQLLQFAEEGYFMALQVKGARGPKGHWVVADYSDGQDLYIVDSGYPQTKLNGSHYGGVSPRAMLFKAKNGLKLNDSPRINGQTESDAKAEGDKVEEGKTNTNVEEASKGMLSEDELRGMPDALSDPETDMDKIDAPPVTDAIVYAAEDMVQGMEERKGDGFTGIARSAVAFMGILVLFWVTLIGVAFAFDKSNTVLEISAMKVVTFGRLRVKDIDDSAVYYSDGAETQGGKTKQVGVGGVVGIIVLLVVLGVVLLTGVLFDFFLDAKWFVEDMTDKTGIEA